MKVKINLINNNRNHKEISAEKMSFYLKWKWNNK